MLQKSIVKSNISTNDQNLMAHSLVASTYAFYDVWDYFHVALALNILNLYLITGQNTETKGSKMRRSRLIKKFNYI